jgi:hypothetical protein
VWLVVYYLHIRMDSLRKIAAIRDRQDYRRYLNRNSNTGHLYTILLDQYVNYFIIIIILLLL